MKKRSKSVVVFVSQIPLSMKKISGIQGQSFERRGENPGITYGVWKDTVIFQGRIKKVKKKR